MLVFLEKAFIFSDLKIMMHILIIMKQSLVIKMTIEFLAEWIYGVC